LLGLLEASTDEATLALDILFALDLTSDCLSRCWSVLRCSDHPLADGVRKKLDGIKEVKGDRLTLALLDEGLSDYALRSSALELLRKLTWRGPDTFVQALTWLSSEDSEARHLAALLLATQDDLLAVPLSVLGGAARELLLANGASSWSAQHHDARLVRLLGGLWLHGWDSVLTQLWVAQRAEPYVDRKHPSKYWRSFRTYPESEECIHWLLGIAESGNMLLPTFQDATARLVELEGDVTQGAPQAEHIAVVQDEMIRRIDALLTQPATAYLMRFEAAIFAAALRKETIPSIPPEAAKPLLDSADENDRFAALSRLATSNDQCLLVSMRSLCTSDSSRLSAWMRQTLAAHNLEPHSPPAAVARLLAADAADVRAAASVALLTTDLFVPLVAGLVEVAQSPDDRVRMNGERRLYNVCAKLPSDGSTRSVETLTRFCQDAGASKDGHLGTVSPDLCAAVCMRPALN
jgi:hypothetical protein